MLKELRNSGHAPTLAAAFLYFDVSFMVWVILGPLVNFIGKDLHLSAAEKGFLTAVPLLGGSFFRLILGALTERIGGKRTGAIGLGLTLIPLIIGWQFANSFNALICMGLLLGVAGASFAAALPMASAWYPPHLQGLVLGIAGAGNSGTLLSTFFAPRLAQAYGWHTVFGIALIPVSIVWILLLVLAKDAPMKSAPKTLQDYGRLLSQPDSYWFCFLYSITFGGFVGMASYLSVFFKDQYGLTNVQAGDFTTMVVIFGSFLRPVGGTIADRIGGHRLLIGLFSGVGIVLAIISTMPPAMVALGLFALTMAMLGMGNGAIFQLVPQRFAGSVGVITGLVGAAGGLGGFLLPSLLGTVKGATGGFAPGFVVLSATALTGAMALAYLGRVWRRTWSEENAMRAGLRPKPEVVLDGAAA